jgi:uncharacterized membrane protein YjfL (UPF0719 family)
MTIADQLLDLLYRIGWSLPLFVLAFGAVWLAKVLYQWTARFNFADQLTEKDNPALGTALAGYLVGVTIALTGAFPNQPVADWPALLDALGVLAWQGALVAVLMRLSVWMVGRFVLYKFGVDEEMVRDRNVGAGAVLAGGCIAAGLVLHGALSGESDSRWLALRDFVVYWAAGQLILLAGSWLYIHVVRFDVEKVIQEDNAAAGFSLGGFLAAVGIIINASLAGAYGEVAVQLLVTLVYSLIGLGLLVCSAIIGARVFLPHSPMSKEIAVDRNPAAGLISAACFIAIALLLARVIASQ